MGIDAFIVYDLDVAPKAFAEQYLVSKDFTVELLREIARASRSRGLPNTKADLAQLIVRDMGEYSTNIVADRIAQALVTRKREGMAIKFGRVNRFYSQRDPKLDFIHLPW